MKKQLSIALLGVFLLSFAAAIDLTPELPNATITINNGGTTNYINQFNQSLNTSDNVTFYNLTINGIANFTSNTTSEIDFCISGGNCLSNMGSGGGGFQTDQNDELNTTGSPSFRSLNTTNSSGDVVFRIRDDGGIFMGPQNVKVSQIPAFDTGEAVTSYTYLAFNSTVDHDVSLGVLGGFLYYPKINTSVNTLSSVFGDVGEWRLGSGEPLGAFSFSANPRFLNDTGNFDLPLSIAYFSEPDYFNGGMVGASGTGAASFSSSINKSDITQIARFNHFFADASRNHVNITEEYGFLAKGPFATAGFYSDQGADSIFNADNGTADFTIQTDTITNAFVVNGSLDTVLITGTYVNITGPTKVTDGAGTFLANASGAFWNGINLSAGGGGAETDPLAYNGTLLTKAVADTLYEPLPEYGSTTFKFESSKFRIKVS